MHLCCLLFRKCAIYWKIFTLYKLCSYIYYVRKYMRTESLYIQVHKFRFLRWLDMCLIVHVAHKALNGLLKINPMFLNLLLSIALKGIWFHLWSISYCLIYGQKYKSLLMLCNNFLILINAGTFVFVYSCKKSRPENGKSKVDLVEETVARFSIKI